jgi:hypothetical protein
MTQFNSPDFHQEVIKRFLEKLGGAADALGDPPQLSIKILQGEITRSGAETSYGRYEPGDICYCDLLVATVPTRAHACALLLSSHRLISAATGLFSTLRIEWSDGNFNFSHAVPDRQENYD